MKTLKLLPNGVKKVGWFLFLPALFLGILYLFLSSSLEVRGVELPVVYNSGFIFGIGGESGFFRTANIDWLANLLGILIIIGGMLVGFSAEKNEDEYISSLRLKSVLWSLAVSYSVVLALYLTVFGGMFFTVMILSMYLPLTLYIFRFEYLVRK